MDTSRRAVESYWRSRMIDAATSDEDKVTPVYKLEEICELLRSSPSGIVKEVSEFLLKRLDHKNPIVKQKALRLIKYSVGKSGAEFRREMQRHSVAVKQLLHYKGKPDPLKGDALNKAVRETAQDALSAIFSTDDNKPAAASEVTHKRMEGFGNTNYVMPPEEKKSFISEVVGIGSASLKQGLSTLAQAHSQSFKKNDTGSYRGPTLNRSLTVESDHSDRYDKMSYHGGGQSSSSISRNATSGPWGQDSRTVASEATNVDSNSSYGESKTREERFLETIVTSGGVRLQPTRDVLQAFLVEASKMDALALSRALESKLQSPNWQVRMKAVCVVEAILRKKDDEHFAIIAYYFTEHVDLVIKCSESPQSSLREKANRVLSLIGGEQTGNSSEKPTKVERTVVEMPDLIDTGYGDLLGEEPKESQNEQFVASKPLSSSLLIDDLFGDSTGNDLSKSDLRTDDDPFADVSFHTGEDKDQGSDLFAGMTVGETSSTVEAPRNGGPDLFDIFGSSEPLQVQGSHTDNVNNLMAGLSISGNGSVTNEKTIYSTAFAESTYPGSNLNPASQGLNDSLSSGFDPLKATANANTLPMGSIPYNMPPGMLYNQFYPAAQVNYGAMGGFLAQQQFMAAMANLQSIGNMNPNNLAGGNLAGTLGGDASALPDIFNANMPAQASTVTMNAPKEETKAFDFITDHLTQARDPKRVV
ncbi:VHS domain-containing protein At3g16270-like [Chenopodium quinoa]|uniref:VHS domain-containing protein n=1 Tax=Chenopodium quinoa TaxID=63459 RepID=A0A803MLR3_CHEQI|nr:VHS domain-containing protein At3g16270-like [Chenopodium quinoa]